jgi:hypothetical protein
MSDKKPTIKKKEDERKVDNERSLEVSFMILLMRKYPDKAKDAARKLNPQTAEAW